MTIRQATLVLCELTDPGIAGVDSYSPFCLKVHRALRAAGLAYERRLADRPDAWKAHNPTGQVPVLLIDGEAVFDSTRILQRLDAETSAFTHGLDARQRAEAWLWEEFADSTLSGFLISARWADADNWPKVRDTFFGGAPWFVRRLIAPKIRARMLRVLVARDVLRHGWAACQARFVTTLDLLEERAPERGFWVSETVSVADLALFGHLHNLRTPLTPAQAAEVTRRPRLRAYLDRVDAATRTRAEPARSHERQASARA